MCIRDRAHLVELGHRRIGLAAGPVRFVPVVRKTAGFRAAMTRLTGACLLYTSRCV